MVFLLFFLLNSTQRTDGMEFEETTTHVVYVLYSFTASFLFLSLSLSICLFVRFIHCLCFLASLQYLIRYHTLTPPA